ncbi:MAG: DNA repair protein RecN [Rhodoferax sp.]
MNAALKRMVLRDFVIVQELELDLQSGFTVLTGETGAGKSILIDALQLVTGARAQTDVIREGASRAEVSAEFAATPEVRQTLQEQGFDEDDTLLLRRTVDSAGKSRAWVNGSPATAQQLRALGELLLDIHGQHAWQSLTRVDAVRGLLDAYARISTATLSQRWQAWRLAHGALTDAQVRQQSLQQERERLQWQIGELDKLAPQPQEWDELQTAHSRLANAQALIDAARQALDVLADADTHALGLLEQATQALQTQERLESDFRNPLDVLQGCVAQAEDAAHSLRAYLRHAEPDPERLAELDARMAQWVGLARRYRRSPEELPDLLTQWRTELAALDAATDLESLQQAEQAAQAAYQAEARTVSKARTQAAPRLGQAITQAMQGLGMQGGVFQVQLEALSQPQQSGLEDVAFLVAGHAGSTPRPVGKVASGGELSRIALAIAVTTSQLGTAQTLIFDEVDSGVGGAVAETVGRLMRQLGADRQVLAVTHLPQVAACANHHLVVSKQSDGQRTSSTVRAVDGEARVGEIARMLGGEKLSGTTRAHAAEMLQSGA